MDRLRYAKYEGNLYDYDKVKFSLKYIKNKDVLDIGSASSGYPYVFDWLRKHAKSVIGIDNDARNVPILRKKGYDIRLGDAETFNLKKKFEVITFFDLIEHTSNPGNFLLNLKRNLKPDGVIIFNTPNSYSFNGFINILLKGKFRIHPEHTVIFDTSTLRELLNRCGFNIIEARIYTNLTKGNVPLSSKLLLAMTKFIGIFRPQLNKDIFIVARNA